eukprot:6192412-Pleurochrysis_carterae.AAC.1
MHGSTVEGALRVSVRGCGLGARHVSHFHRLAQLKTLVFVTTHALRAKQSIRTHRATDQLSSTRCLIDAMRQKAIKRSMRQDITSYRFRHMYMQLLALRHRAIPGCPVVAVDMTTHIW